MLQHHHSKQHCLQPGIDCTHAFTDVFQSQVPPALKLAPGGKLIEQKSGSPAVLRGVNWFGWSVGSFNFDGQWAFCDDNTTYSSPPCAQDGDIPPYGNVGAKEWSPAVGEAAQRMLNISYW
jgi:hypothetical protein